MANAYRLAWHKPNSIKDTAKYTAYTLTIGQQEMIQK